MLAGKSTRNRPLGWPKFQWEDNIRIVLKEIRGIGSIRLGIGIIREPL